MGIGNRKTILCISCLYRNSIFTKGKFFVLEKIYEMKVMFQKRAEKRLFIPALFSSYQI